MSLSFRQVAGLVAALAEDADQARLDMYEGLYGTTTGVCLEIQKDLEASGLVPEQERVDP